MLKLGKNVANLFATKAWSRNKTTAIYKHPTIEILPMLIQDEDGVISIEQKFLVIIAAII